MPEGCGLGIREWLASLTDAELSDELRVFLPCANTVSDDVHAAFALELLGRIGAEARESLLEEMVRRERWDAVELVAEAMEEAAGGEVLH